MITAPDLEPFGDRHPRIAGLILLGVSLIIAKWQIYNPLHAEEYGYTTYWVSGKLIGLGVLLGVYGALMCLLGNALKSNSEADAVKKKKYNIIFGCVGAAISLVIYIFVMRSLSIQGYAAS